MEYTNLEKTLSDIGKLIKDKYKEKIKQTAYATGKLFNSIDYRIEQKDNTITLYFIAEKYYLNIENGRKAGSKMPPLTVIKKWMLTKGIPEKDGTAYAIARSIAKKGIKAKPELRDIRIKLPSYKKELTAALELDFADAIKQIIKK